MPLELLVCLLAALLLVILLSLLLWYPAWRILLFLLFHVL